eukprot:535661-Prorocentrum_lima.AAC.1
MADDTPLQEAEAAGAFGTAVSPPQQQVPSPIPRGEAAGAFGTAVPPRVVTLSASASVAAPGTA